MDLSNLSQLHGIIGAMGNLALDDDVVIIRQIGFDQQLRPLFVIRFAQIGRYLRLTMLASLLGPFFGGGLPVFALQSIEIAVADAPLDFPTRADNPEWEGTHDD